MQEGLAHVCLITPSMTILKQRVEMAIPRKRRQGASQHDKQLVKFFEATYKAVQRFVQWDVVKTLLVCSPGFVNADFLQYCMEQAVKADNKLIVKSKPKWLLAPCSSGHLHCLKEVMGDKSVTSKLADSKATSEVRAMETFFKMMETDEDRAVYGPLPVLAAAEKQAIESVLILDTLFRSRSIAERKKWVGLVEDVKEYNGEVHIFSSMHVTGEQLSNLNGVAALLRFPCPELNDLDSEDEPDIIPTNNSVLYLDEIGDDY